VEIEFVVAKVRKLFHAFPELLQGFKVFLPKGNADKEGISL
jgi:histone deacetylase complex regulatory component SIN3